MIKQIQNEKQTQLILAPNKSMSWETNKKILIGIFIVNMTIAIAWSLMGAWLVLPFAGLEVLLVGLGMYYACWKLNFKHIITIEAESFILQKGVYFPKQEWQWQKSHVRLMNKPNQYRMSAPHLFLNHLNDKIEVGEFLNQSEKKQFKGLIKELNIPVIMDY